MATMRDVAETAGVSIQTVSNVLNGKAFVRPEIQARVMEAVVRLNYRPNRVAQRMRRGQAQALGFIVSDPNPRGLADPFYGEVLTGLAEMARARDYDVLIEWLPSDQPVRADDILSPFQTRRIDGAVIFLHGENACNPHLLNELIEAHAVFVMLECDSLGDRGYSVCAANFEGGRAVTQHLIARGHRRIAFLDSTQRWPAVDERRRGYESAMRAYGLDAYIMGVSSPDWTHEGGALAVGRMLEASDARPTAIAAATDLLAVGAMQAIRARGLRIPDDIAVTGFDDFDFASFVEPALTTVRLPAHEMGSRAAEMLLGHLSGGEVQPRHVVLPTELVVRRSA
ncbi:MAG: LacI family DNA-binding transcriptional regulator [Anaerolineae bacterium]|nr:LacI family transcriptional regulator [Candidatus Roseilinea sp.]MDW8448401.1 LacI family DNA-binding transcriptional regulator [Anaerolineae bacterium]